MKSEFDLFRLEDRVLFEAAAAVEIVEAAEAAHDDPNANVNQGEKQAQDDRDALKNVPPANPADQALHHDVGDAPDDPAHNADVDAQVDKIINGDLPVIDDAALDHGVDHGVGPALDDLLHPAPVDGDHLVLNDHGESVSTGKELVVINSSVMDADAILGELAPNQEVLHLDSGSDAMDQILDYLNSSDTHYDAIHIVSHGNDGYFVLNGEVVDGDHFDAAEWAAVGEHLTDHGDIMIYGCDLAKSDAGQHLVDMIADATGADVAASTDATGLGGDWDLEFHHGVIETASISVSGYEYQLHNIQVTSGLNDGVGSLRDAIGQSHSGDEITFADSVGKVTLTSDISIDKDLTISGDRLSYTVLEGNGTDDILRIDGYTTTVTLENLAFHNGGDGAIWNNATLNITHCLFSGNSGDTGGAIHNQVVVNIKDSVFTDNSATSGGAIGNSGILNITGTTFSGNSASECGGAIYNMAGNNGGAVSNFGTLILVNSTVYGNRPEGNGGGIYSGSNMGKVIVVNSTLAGNSAQKADGGGGIYMDPGYNNANLEVINSIVVGNYTGDDPTAANDIGGEAAKFSRSFLVYGVITMTSSISDGESNIASDVDKTFHAKWDKDNTSGKWELVDRNDETPIFQNGMVKIYADSVGAIEGTLVGWKKNSGPADFNKLWEGNFYYRSSWSIDSGSWVSMDGGGNIDFITTVGAVNFGLGDNAVALMFAAGQNGISRTDVSSYNIGAYALQAHKPDVVVNTNLDSASDHTNPFDDVTTLRDAIQYAGRASWFVLDKDNQITEVFMPGNEVRFDKAFFTTDPNHRKTIVLDRKIQILREDHIRIAGVDQDGNDQVDANGESYIVIDGGGINRIFEIGNGNRATDVAMYNLILQNGHANGVGMTKGGAVFNWVNSKVDIDRVISRDNEAQTGGAIYNAGTLSVTNSIFSGNSGDNGGAIYNAGTLTAENINFNANLAARDGGAIYNTSAGTLTINSATFSKNTVMGSGGAIFNDAGRMTVANSTFYDQKSAGDGGAIYNNKGRLTVVGSTFYHNTAGIGVRSEGGAIFSNGAASRLVLVNSILVGNIADVAAANDLSTQNAELDLYYSFYGQLSGNIGKGVASWGKIKVKDVFGDSPSPAEKEINGVKQIYFELKDGVDAVTMGTKVQVDGGGFLQYYYMDGPFKWETLGAIALTTAQLQHDQIGRSRQLHDSSEEYSVGAISMIREDASLTVDTVLDVVDPYDGVISLREALAYAAAGIKETDGSYTVTFANSLGSNIVITLDPALKALTVDSALFTKDAPLTIDGEGRVTLDGGHTDSSGGSQFLNIAAGNFVFLNNMTFRNGYAGGDGGAITNAGTLTITNVTFAGNSADGDGGAIANTGTLNIKNVNFNHNTAVGNGGAIYSEARSSLTINTATFRENSGGSGGAIYNAGTLTVANSTFFGNEAVVNGGAIYSGNASLLVVGTTIYDNTANKGGGVYSPGIVIAVNSIFVGNRDSVKGDFYVGQADLYYSFYGGESGRLGTTPGSRGNIKASDVFGDSPTPAGKVINGVTQNYFELKDEAAIGMAGTKVQVDGNGFLQYYDMTDPGNRRWCTIGAFALTTAQLQVDQIGRYRLTADSFFKYSPGAVQQQQSLTVTTDLDVVNPNDGLISLREALAHAAMGFTAADGSYTITFADSLGPKITITLDGALGALSIDSPQFKTAPLTIEGGGRVTLDGGGATHILEIAADNRVSLHGMTFQNGRSGGDGGAIYNAGTLSVTGAAFTGNMADGGVGGAIYNTGSLVIANASFTGNLAGDGGAIYSNGLLTVVNSTFYRNEANDYGGAIYFTGGTKFELTVAGSTLTGNIANGGDGGGIFVWNGAITLVNDIIVDNLSPADGKDIQSNGDITAIGLVYGTAVGSFVTEWHSYSNVQASQIFTTKTPSIRVVDGITQSYFEVKNTPDVKVTSAGTKLQVDENSGNLQYYDIENSSWVNLGTTSLTTELVQHDQIGRARMMYDSSSEYGIGAISMHRETPSLTVNTDLDLVDPYDGRISLREALAYAAAGTRAFDGSYTVDFANLFSGTIIMLDPALGALTVKAGSFAADDPLIINGNGEVTIVGGGLTQLFVIGRDNEVRMNVFTLSEGFAEDGGAIYNAGSLTMNRVTFNSNSADNGGAIYNAGTLTITNSTFSNNAAGIAGGAVYNAGTLTVENADFNANTTQQNGGGIFNAAECSLTVNGATFRHNIAENFGGAIYNAGTLTVANATLFENSADRDGGVIYNTGTLTVAGATFFKNEAGGNGGAVYSIGKLRLANSILAGNTGGEDLYADGVAEGYYSFIGSMQGAFTGNVANHFNVTPEEIFGDRPAVSTTKINGVTQSYFELKDSALAVTAGTKLRVVGGNLQYYDMTAIPRWADIGAVALSTAQLQYDQIGRARLTQDLLAAYSIGAISMLKENPSLIVTTDQDVVNPYDDVISLRETLAFAAAGIRAADHTYTITFADSLANSIIEIDSKLGSLTVGAGAFSQGDSLTIDGGGKITVNGRYYTHGGILEIGADNYVFLNGLIFEDGGNAKGLGGAIINAGNLTVTNTTFTGNGISGQRGGGAIYNTGNLVIDNAAFIGNQSSEGGGGAIYNTGSLVVNNATFSRNLADTNRGNSGGGAIWNSNGQVVVANTTFTGNRTNGKGGAIYAENGTLVVLNSTITQNNGKKDGSGIYCDSAELAIANSIILGNTGSRNIKVDGNNGFSAVYLVTSEAPLKTPDYSDHNFFDCQDDPFTDGNPRKRTVNGVEQLYFEVKDVSAVEITTDGTKLRPYYGKNGCDIEYYSKDSSNWQTLINYLKSVPTENQFSYDQIGRDRLMYDQSQDYSIGAVNMLREQPSLTVTTDLDLVDPCDGRISLREAALYYAHSGDTVTFAGKIAAVLDHDLELKFDLNLNFGDTGASVSGGRDGIALKSEFALIVQGAAAFNHLLLSGKGDLSFTGSTDGSATVDRTGGGVIYSSADSQVIYGGRYFDLSLTGTGADGAEEKEFGGDIAVANSFDASGTANGQYLQINGSHYQLTLPKTGTVIHYTDIHDLTAAESLVLDDTNTVVGTTNIAVYLNTLFDSGKSITYGQTLSDAGAFQLKAYARGILLSGDWSFLNGTTRPQVKDSDVTSYEIILGGYYSKATLTVTPKQITVSGIAADNRVYDGTTAATLDYTNAVLTGKVTGDTLSVSTTGTFADKNVGVDKVVTLGALTLTGIDARNYVLAGAGQQSTTTATITVRVITVSGIAADDRVYDGTTAATLDYTNAVLNGKIANDELSVSTTGTFADKNVGVDKVVTLGTLTLNGTDARNYVLAVTGQQTTTTATITARAITVSGIAADDRTYDGTTDATLDYTNAVLAGKVANDELSVSTTGSFADKNVGVDKVVTLGTLILSGTDARNYVLAGAGQQTTTTATITARAITVSGIAADDRAYDGTTAATLDYTNAVLTGKLAGDTLNVSTTGAFADKNVGADKVVTLGILTLNGTDARNYVLAVTGQQTTTTATITARAIMVSGIAADDRVYDGTTAATLDYTNAVLNGKIANDELSVSTTGTFADKNVGVDKVVTLGTLTLNGTDARNYVLAGTGQQTTTTATITARAITVSGIAADDHVYDGTTAATLDYTNAVLSGKVTGDTLSVSATGVFADKNAGVGKTVNLGALTLSGADVGNYILAGTGQQTSTTATITPRDITVTADEQTKIAGTADPELTYQLTEGSLVDGDGFSGELTRDAGEKAGDYAIRQGTLTAGGNYNLTYVGANLTIVAKPVFDSGIYSSGLNPNFASALITDSVRAELKNLLTSFAGDNFKLLGINSLPAALSFYDYLSDIGDGIEWNNINFTDFAHDATIQRLFGQVTDYLGLDRNQATWSPRLIYALNHLKADVEDLLGINSSAELYENGNISYGPDYSFRSPVVHTMGFGTFIGVRNFSPYRTPIDDVPGIANSDTLLPNMALNGASGPAEDVISIPGAENTGFRYLAPEMPPIKPGRNAQLADAELQKLLRDFGPVRGDALLEKSRAFKSEFELLLDELVTA